MDTYSEPDAKEKKQRFKKNHLFPKPQSLCLCVLLEILLEQHGTCTQRCLHYFGGSLLNFSAAFIDLPWSEQQSPRT